MVLIAPALAGSSEAADKVREGIAQFRGGDFKAAAEAFSAAGEALPNELKIAFDRGCAYAANGEFDKAVEQFQKAAAASDHKLAALAHYNLGGVAVAGAKAKLGDKPEEAEGDARTAALESLARAARHYRDCLGVDPENADARYNLETLCLWIKHIQDLWRQRDRQKRRDAMNLLEYLQWLESEQQDLRQSSKDLGTVKSSPRQREAIRAVENAQRALAEEIQPLKEKIASSLSAPQQQPGKGMAASPGADVQKAVELLDRLADEIHGSMNKAADWLAGLAGDRAGDSPAEAVNSQSQAVETIDQIFMAVAPYANLVERGINRQEDLINQSPAAEKPEKSDEQNISANQGQATRSLAVFDGNEAAWNQRFIARYGRIIAVKARRELEQFESAPAAKPQPTEQSAVSSPPDDDAATTTDAGAPPSPDKDQPAADERLTDQQQQRRDLKEALQLGVQSAPKVEKLADQSAALLEEDKPGEALPKQQEALKLLKDMLPKQQQQEKDKKDQDKKDQEKKDQEKKDQQKQDQNKKDQERKDQQNNEQQNKDQDKQDQNKQDRQKKDENKDQQLNKQEQKQRDLNKEQAESVLNKARQRQNEYRELQKRLEGYLYRPEKVDKDW